MEAQDPSPMVSLASTSRALNKQSVLQRQNLSLSIPHSRLQKLSQMRKNRRDAITSNIHLQRHQRPNSLEGSKTVASNIRVLRKAAMFIENLKTTIVLSKSALTDIQSFYLQNQDGRQEQQPGSLIAWDNSLLLVFEILFTILLIFQSWVLTYQIVMEKISWALGLHISLLLSFLVFILLRVNTQLKTQRLQYIHEKRKIILYYLRNDFPSDGAAVFCLLLVVLQEITQIQSVQFRIISRLLWMLSLKSIFRLLNKIQDLYAVQSSVQRSMTLGIFFFKIIVFLHFLSLLLNLIAKIQMSLSIENNWIVNNNLQQSTQFELYLNGYYWASTIVSTVGFGDFSPGNVYQRALMSFIMLFCCLFFGYCLNIIGSLISIIGQSNVQYQKDIRKLNHYLKTAQADTSLQEKLKQHFHNRHQIQQRYDMQTQQYLCSKMTEQLRTALSRSSTEQVISKSLQLKIFSQKTRKRLAKAMTKRVYGPGQVIFNQGDSSIKFYLVREGLVNEYCYLTQGSSQKKPVAKYNAQDNTLGWINILTGNSYQTFAKSQGFSLVHEIEKSNFERILKQEPKDFIRFNQFKQKNILKKYKLKKQCIVCSRFNHNVVQCPKIHFIARPIQLIVNQIAKQLKKCINLRKNDFLRSKKRAYLVWQDNQQDFQKFLESNEEQIYRNCQKNERKTIVRNNSIKSFKNWRTIQQISSSPQTQTFLNMFNPDSRSELSNGRLMTNMFVLPFLDKSGEIQKQKSAQMIGFDQLVLETHANPKQVPQNTQLQSFDRMMDEQSKNFFSNFSCSKILQKYSTLKQRAFGLSYQQSVMIQSLVRKSKYFTNRPEQNKKKINHNQNSKK